MNSAQPIVKALDLVTIIDRVASNFPTRFYHHYARWKLRSDPIYATVFDLLQGQAPLPTLDIGCGIGLLEFYLRERGLTFPIHGVDFDIEKIGIAGLIAHSYSPPLAFHCGNANQPWPDCHGNVCLLDVLLYLNTRDQHALLKLAADHVTTKGMLIIRSGIRERNWRYYFTAYTDRLMNFTRLMKSPPLTYPTREELEQAMSMHGMKLRECLPLYGKTPFNNYLLVFERVM